MAPYVAESVGALMLIFGGPGAAAVNAASGGSVQAVRRHALDCLSALSSGATVADFVPLVYRLRGAACRRPRRRRVR